MYSTCIPASRRPWVAAWAASYSTGPILSLSKASVANAVRPSGLTVGPRGSYGLVTPTTCGTRASAVRAWAKECLAAAPVTPSSECTTTCAASTLCAGNRSLRASAARCDSAPGSRKVSLVAPPKAELSANAMPATRTQAASTRQG